MRKLLPQLNRWRQSYGLWVLAIVASLSLIAAGAEFFILLERENQLVDRMSDTAFWMAVQFRAEIQQLHAAVAAYDGSQDALDEVHDRYEILVGRIALMDESKLVPRPDAILGRAISDVRKLSADLAPQIAALTPGARAPRHLITVTLPTLERAAGRMTTLGTQADAQHREAGRTAIYNANVLLGGALVALIGSLLLSLRALERQAGKLDAARRKSEALGAELTVALAQAQAGSRAKNVFLATMSHEIRTPMNGVLGAASLLVQTPLSEQQQRWVSIIRACGEALLAQLDDVLDFSALEAASVRLDREAFDVRALAEDALRVVESAAAGQGLDLVAAVDASVPGEVVTDRRRLGQVLINLLTNAIKFTSAGGVALHVTVRRRRGLVWVRAAVTDSGIGIPRPDRQKIFKEFTRLERSSERTVRGTGLGLAISQRIAHAMGGGIRVAAAQGGGSVFWITVPVDVPDGATGWPVPSTGQSAAVIGGAPGVSTALRALLRAQGFALATLRDGADIDVLLLAAGAREPDGLRVRRRIEFGRGRALDMPVTAARLEAALSGQTARRRIAAPAPVQGRLLRLLVTDDDAINREIAASLLRHLGHEVEVASDGREALEIMRTTEFDAVLVDLYMPVMDGLTFARAVRALPPPRGTVRLVAVTADADANIRATVLAAGIDAALTKPVSLERLAEALLPVAGQSPRAVVAAAPGGVLDRTVRDILLSRLPEGQLPGLLKTFWTSVGAAVGGPPTRSAAGLDRWLHTLVGSAGSLGYMGVTAASREAQQACRDNRFDREALMAVYEALDAALHADQAQLPMKLVASVAQTLAETMHAGALLGEAVRMDEPVGGHS